MARSQRVVRELIGGSVGKPATRFTREATSQGLALRCPRMSGTFSRNADKWAPPKGGPSLGE